MYLDKLCYSNFHRMVVNASPKNRASIIHPEMAIYKAWLNRVPLKNLCAANNEYNNYYADIFILMNEILNDK